MSLSHVNLIQFKMKTLLLHYMPSGAESNTVKVFDLFLMFCLGFWRSGNEIDGKLEVGTTMVLGFGFLGFSA